MVKHFENLSQKELEIVREENKGKPAFLVIHPFYILNEDFIKFVLSGEHKKYLTLVFADPISMKATMRVLEKLEKYVAKGNSLFLVSTKKELAAPTAGWQKIFERMKAVGVQRVLIGGQQRGKESTRYMEKYFRENFIGDKKEKIKDALSFFRTARRAFPKRNTVPTRCTGSALAKAKARGFKARLTRRF